MKSGPAMWGVSDSRWRGILEPTDGDEVLQAIDSVVQALTENLHRTEMALQRAAEIRERRLAGPP